MTKARDIADGVDTADIADGAISTAKLADNSINATKLDVSGNGTAGQFLSSDGDGSMTWADAGGGFTPTTASGTSQALDLGSYNFFNGGTHTGNTTLSFSNVPTEANWRYTFKAGGDAYNLDRIIFDNVSQLTNIAFGQAKSFQFKSDGTKIYMCNYSSEIYQFSLSTAWDIRTASYDSKYYTALSANDIRGFFFNTDGTRMIMFSGANRQLRQVTLSTAWDISTAGSVTSSSTMSGYTSGNIYGADLSSDGTKLLLTDLNGDQVLVYTLSTAFDGTTCGTTATNTKTIGDSNSPETTYTHSIWNDDGTVFYAIGNTQDTPQKWEMSTAYDVSTATFTGNVQLVGINYNQANHMRWANNGKQLVINDYNNRSYSTFRVGSPYTLTLPSSVQNRTAPRDNYVPDDIITYEFYTTDGGTNVYIINDNVT
jgi:hypothetical protein